MKFFSLRWNILTSPPEDALQTTEPFRFSHLVIAIQIQVIVICLILTLTGGLRDAQFTQIFGNKTTILGYSSHLQNHLLKFGIPNFLMTHQKGTKKNTFKKVSTYNLILKFPGKKVKVFLTKNWNNQHNFSLPNRNYMNYKRSSS